MSSQTPSAWEAIPFREALAPVPVEKTEKILARDYADAGAIPVVDQGQDFIAGWTDSEDAVIRDGLPYVVFGDHTRLFKFVDFPFALGADGTQLLKPRPTFNPRFFYYACRHLQIPNRGYNRHFSLVKEMSLPRPPLLEQGRIAAVLALVQRAIENEEKAIAATRELKRGAMSRLFTRDARGDARDDSALGQVPASWGTTAIASLGDVVTGTTPKTAERSYYDGGTIPFIAPGDLGQTLRVHTAAKHITPSGLSVSRPLPRGAVLFVCIGSSIGKVGVTTAEASSTNQQINAIVPSSEHDSLFLGYLLDHFSERLASHASPSPVPIMSKGVFAQLGIVVPPLRDDEISIARTLTAIDSYTSFYETRRAKLAELFTSLLDKLMTGAIRVADLDIDTSAVEAA